MQDYIKKPESQSRTLDSNPKASRQAPIDVILQRYGERSIQQYADNEELMQDGFESAITNEQEPVQREKKTNNTGLPENVKTGIENLSGYNMDDVKVHYNSDKPAQINALAYAQGTNIHVAPGQEKHLPHEAWHVVQQKQGRVQPNMQLQEININDNKELEKEADMMGEKALYANNSLKKDFYSNKAIFYSSVQRRDTTNPHERSDADKETLDGWELTAHHIIPLSLLAKVFKLLNEEMKARLKNVALPAGCDNEDDMTPYIEWPKGNLFYGPNTSIRTEPGEKDDFDSDAVFFLPPNRFIKMKKFYIDLLPFKSKKVISKEQKETLFNLLEEFYKYTKDFPSINYHKEDWSELKTEEELEKAKLFRDHTHKYSFYKISIITDKDHGIHPLYPDIHYEGGEYKYKENKIEGRVGLHFFYIKISVRNEKVLNYLKTSTHKAEISTYLPKKLNDTYKNLSVEKIIFLKQILNTHKDYILTTMPYDLIYKIMDITEFANTMVKESKKNISERKKKRHIETVIRKEYIYLTSHHLILGKDLGSPLKKEAYLCRNMAEAKEFIKTFWKNFLDD